MFLIVLLIVTTALLALWYWGMTEWYVSHCHESDSHESGVNCPECGYKGLTLIQRYERYGNPRKQR